MFVKSRINSFLISITSFRNLQLSFFPILFLGFCIRFQDKCPLKKSPPWENAPGNFLPGTITPGKLPIGKLVVKKLHPGNLLSSRKNAPQILFCIYFINFCPQVKVIFIHLFSLFFGSNNNLLMFVFFYLYIFDLQHPLVLLLSQQHLNFITLDFSLVI